MNILPELLPALNDLQDSFSGRFTAVNAPRPNEVYFDAPMELVAGFCAQLYRKWNARLVCLFADDPHPAVDAFHLYYVFALDGAHGFFVLRLFTSASQLADSLQNQPIGNPYFDKCGNKVQLYSVCECRNDKCDCSGREEKTITKRKNRQPNQPLLLGPDGKTTSQGGQKGVPIAFSVSAKDPDGDMVRYKVNWGDGPTSESGPVASGTSWSVSHIWRSSKNYKVEAIAIDQCDEESSSSCYIDIIIV